MSAAARPADPQEVSLYLSDIHNFFQTPEIDPFLGENIEASGIDQLMDAMKARPQRARQVRRIILHLPETAIAPDLAARTRAAVQSYCNTQIRLDEQKIREIFLTGRRALRIGVLFLGICLAISALSETLFSDRNLLSRLFVEGFIIAGWVGLWHPIEILLFEWQPYRSRVKLFRQIHDMDVRIVPGKPPAP